MALNCGNAVRATLHLPPRGAARSETFSAGSNAPMKLCAAITSNAATCHSALHETELVPQRVGQNFGSVPTFVVVFLHCCSAEGG